MAAFILTLGLALCPSSEMSRLFHHPQVSLTPHAVSGTPPLTRRVPGPEDCQRRLRQCGRSPRRAAVLSARRQGTQERGATVTAAPAHDARLPCPVPALLPVLPVSRSPFHLVPPTLVSSLTCLTYYFSLPDFLALRSQLSCIVSGFVKCMF